jgi:hypothetical protein
MAGKLKKTTAELLVIIAVAVLARMAWGLWSDGSYDPWRVLGIIGTLIALAGWTAWQRYYAAAILGTTLGVFGTAIRWTPNSRGDLSLVNAVVLCPVAFVLAALITLAVLLIRLRAHIQEQIERQ